MPLLSGYDHLYPKKNKQEELHLAEDKDLETFYSPLGEPDLKDLPSFAYQITQGMVCKTNSKIHFLPLQTAIFTYFTFKEIV